MAKNKTVVYVPDGAKINIDNNKMNQPCTQYENRKKIIDLNKAKQIIGGVYGKFAKYCR